MILLTYSKLDYVVKKRDWFFHYWRPPHYWDPITDKYECMPPRCYVKMDHEKIINCISIRLLGIEICWIKTGKCYSDVINQKSQKIPSDRILPVRTI